jgi:hypothetical protein
MVTSTSKSGQLDLTMFGLNAHNVQPCSGVRHKDDPYHDDHPAHARENGVWDFLEPVCTCCDVPLPETVTVVVPADAGHAKVLALLYERYGEGASKKIAEDMTKATGEPWSHQKVNMQLRLLKKQGVIAEQEPSTV